jgi:hypothetical protein
MSAHVFASKTPSKIEIYNSNIKQNIYFSNPASVKHMLFETRLSKTPSKVATF